MCLCEDSFGVRRWSGVSLVEGAGSVRKPDREGFAWHLQGIFRRGFDGTIGLIDIDINNEYELKTMNLRNVPYICFDRSVRP